MTDLSRLSLLLVDDETELLAVTKMAIEDYFDRVYTATHVIEALEILNKSKVDLVVCDFKMPEQSGLALRQIMKEQHPNVHFILITGAGQDPEVLKAEGEDGLTVLRKPIKAQVLVEALVKALTPVLK